MLTTDSDNEDNLGDTNILNFFLFIQIAASSSLLSSYDHSLSATFCYKSPYSAFDNITYSQIKCFHFLARFLRLAYTITKHLPAYSLCQRHRPFLQSMDEHSSTLPSLHPLPPPAAAQSHSKRTPENARNDQLLLVIRTARKTFTTDCGICKPNHPPPIPCPDDPKNASHSEQSNHSPSAVHQQTQMHASEGE